MRKDGVWIAVAVAVVFSACQVNSVSGDDSAQIPVAINPSIVSAPYSVTTEDLRGKQKTLEELQGAQIPKAKEVPVVDKPATPQQQQQQQQQKPATEAPVPDPLVGLQILTMEYDFFPAAITDAQWKQRFMIWLLHTERLQNAGIGANMITALYHMFFNMPIAQWGSIEWCAYTNAAKRFNRMQIPADVPVHRDIPSFSVQFMRAAMFRHHLINKKIQMHEIATVISGRCMDEQNSYNPTGHPFSTPNAKH